MKVSSVVDCGHEAIADGVGTGSAILSEPRSWEGKQLPKDARVCYRCADAMQVEDLKTGATFTAYLSSDGKSLTTWTGGHLARVTWSNMTTGYTPTGGRYERHSFQATDVHGGRWHGSSPGPGMYARMRRARG